MLSTFRNPRPPQQAFKALIAVLVAALTLVLLAPSSADAQDRDPALAEFYQTLDPHGTWVLHPRYGETWVPYANQDRSWRPYSRGQWVFTEEHGWYWESEEEFGWVVYHYGRWLLDNRYGWMWVPGREWGPAWVAWREGEEAVGWAPLPPEAEFDGSGTSYTFDSLDHPRYANAWIFIAPAMMTAPLVYRYFFPPARSTYFFGRSRFATHYDHGPGRIYNRGIDRRFVEHHSQRPVPVLPIRPVANPRQYGGPPRGDGERRPVGVYRPQIAVPNALPHTGPYTGPNNGPNNGRDPGSANPRGPFSGPSGPGVGGPGFPPRQPAGTGPDRPSPGFPGNTTPGPNQAPAPRPAFPNGTGGDEQFRPRGPMFGGRPPSDGGPGPTSNPPPGNPPPGNPTPGIGAPTTGAPGTATFPRGDGPRAPQPSTALPPVGQPPFPQGRPLPGPHDGRPFGTPPGGPPVGQPPIGQPPMPPRPTVQAPPTPPQGPPPGVTHRPSGPPPPAAPPAHAPPPKQAPPQSQPPAGGPPPEGGGRGPR